ncbi:neural cell adhesion molecule L1.1 [Trichomycterus rosablanca]|uniref:neural cell adhesion molecule L1.1 n=1 Tax=Trichomycterus rosablanca TaxID=2290929 RepID=UPI002F35CDF9
MSHSFITRRKHQAAVLLFLLLWCGESLGTIHIPAKYKTDNLEQPPVITYQSESHTAFQMDDVSLLCEASGNPKPTYRWVKDGELFTEKPLNSGLLTVDENKELKDYQGKYRCYADNKHGTAESALINLITEATPVLAKEKRVVKEVMEGDSAVLHCNPPKSSVTSNIHWMDKKLLHIKLSEHVTMGLDGNLYFANVQASDARKDYTCNAQYIEARTILPKEPITLIVNQTNELVNRRPRLHRPAGSHTYYLALRGESLTLECIPHGLPTPTVKWERKDASLSSSKAIKQSFNRLLHFESISESDDGEYTCTSTNTEGHVTHSYTVSVEAAPYWTKQPQNALYSPGENVRLDCQAEGIPTPHIDWKINGVPISETSEEQRRKVSGGVLILNNVRFGDTAVYQCEASNKHGTILTNTYIHIIKLPSMILTDNQLMYQVMKGAPVFLHCSSFGSPRPQITWVSETGPALFNPKMSQLTNGTLRITNTSHEEAGDYNCTIEGTEKYITAELQVLNNTRIIAHPQNARELRGQHVVLQCEYEVDERLDDPVIQWRRDGQKITSSAQDDKYTVLENGYLNITDVHADDSGKYTCEVITDHDMDTATGTLTVIDKPEAPNSLKLSEKAGHSVTLSWTEGENNNSPVLEFVIEMREDLHSETGAWQEMKRVSEEIHHLEIALNPFCTYHFKVAAVNEVGVSDFSAPSESYTTPPAEPGMNPENVKSDSTDPDTMVITWKEVERKHHNGPDFKYKVLWRESSGSNPHWHQALVSHPPFIVNNTGTFTPFEIKVQAVNDVGEGPGPTAKIGYSGEDMPLEAPSGVEVVPFNSTALTVKWGAVSRESVRGHLLGYKIYIMKLGMKDDHGGKHKRALDRKDERRVIVVKGDKNEEETLTGLEFYTDYELSITAFNSKGEGPLSDSTHFTTPEGAPEPPAFLKYESPSESELILYWGKPHRTNGVLQGYVLQYQEVLEKQSREVEVPPIDPKLTHYRVEQLDPKHTYIFTLRAFTGAGDGEPVYLRATTLLDAVPPSFINATAGETSVNLSWVPGDRQRNIGFTVRYRMDEGQWQESEPVNSTQAFYQLEQLKPGRNYELEIRLNNVTYWTQNLQTNEPEMREVQNGFASQGWFIGLISAIVLLLLLILILCLVKRSKGGKYSVKDKEEGQINSDTKPMKDHEAFGEYSSDNDEKHSLSQRSLSADLKRHSDDSLVEYGDSVDIQFNEDGSFIGQYSGRKDAHPYTQGDHESLGAGSPVNPNMPPPASGSFPTSVTGILGGN